MGRPQTYKPVRFNDIKNTPQDIMQVWFSGVHADIGGGYPEKQSGLSKYPLLWMIDEAEKSGLKFNHANVNQLAWGIPRKRSPFQYVAPDVRGEVHNSLTGAWWILEFLPKSAKYREWPKRQVYFGFYIPDAEPRLIPEGAVVHESVVKRMAEVGGISPGEFAGEVYDVADAGEGGGGGDAGGGVNFVVPRALSAARRWRRACRPGRIHME